MVSGCKCPGSCACKIKKPRKPKALKKAVVGGRVKQPQIVIQGMPPVSTTAIPQGHPYLTVTSDADLKPKRMTTSTQTDLIPKKEMKEMGTETEPLLVDVAKGAKRDVFSIMKEQEATGKILSLTGAGRPARPFSESVAFATSVDASFAPAPAPAPAAPTSVSAALDAFAPARSTQSTLKSFFKKKESK